MKKIILLIVIVNLLGCSKEEDSNTNSDPIVVAGVTLPQADAGLYTVISNSDGSDNLQNSAWFEKPNASIEVGKVSYEIGTASNDLRFFLGNYISVDFVPSNIDETKWTVVGNGNFPSISVTDNQSMPVIGSFSADVSKITSSTSSFSVSNSFIGGADAIIYGLVNLSNQYGNKYFAASSNSSTSHTFNNSDFSSFIQTNNGVRGVPFTVTALKYKTVVENGKTILLVKQYTYWNAVEVI